MRDHARGLSVAGDNIPLSANCKLSHNRKCTELATHDADAESIADYIWDICPLTQPTAGHLLHGHVSGDHWGNTDVKRRVNKPLLLPGDQDPGNGWWVWEWLSPYHGHRVTSYGGVALWRPGWIW